MEVLKKIEEEDEKKTREDMITITGGVEMDVRHTDGSVERVKVRQIPATKLEEFMTKVANEAVSVSIYCDRPLEWADTLDLSSIGEICNKGMEINESFLNAWCLRRAKWTEMLNVGVIAELQRKLTTLQEVLASVTSAQKLPISTGSPQNK